MTHDPRRHSPATERNGPPILRELQRVLPAQGLLLEIASGTGQHAALCSAGLPSWQWQPSDHELAALPSIRAWCAGQDRVHAPLLLDVRATDWPGMPAPVDAVFCANMIHIAPWACCQALLAGAARHLSAHGVLITYGPYLEDGVVTSPGNLAFDADLRERHPEWGLRRLAAVQRAAAEVGLSLLERVAMPANNLLLVWGRTSAEPSPPLALLAQRLERHALPCEGGQVVWRSLGDGPPLVLLHGGHGAWTHWARNIDALAGHFRVLVPDMPGYGDTSPPALPTLPALLEALHTTLDALLGPRTPILLGGFSFGGLVAAHLAVRRGAVARLALLGPAGHGGPRRPKAELHPWREALASPDPAALARVMRHNLQAHLLHGPADEGALHIHTQACLRTRFRSKGISQAGGLGALLQTVAAPKLLVWGEHDVTCTPALLAPAFAEAFAAARSVIVPQAGHWVQYEAAPAINALLLDWLRAPPGSSRQD